MEFKEGDKIKVNLIGNDYRIMWIGDRMVVLETEDKSYQLLTTMDHLRSDAPAKESENQRKM